MWAFRLTAVGILLQLASAQIAYTQTPSPSLLVVNKGANELAIVDPSSMQVVGRVPVAEGPHEVATNGKLAFVTNYGSQTPGNTVSIIDLARLKEIKRLDLGALRRPHGIVINDGKVYFTAEDPTGRWMHASTTRPPDLRPSDGFVRIFDISGAATHDWSTGQYGTHMLVTSKDGKMVFTTNIRSDTVSILELPATSGEAPAITVGKGPEGIDISPDGREVWVAHSGDGGISIISVDSKKVIQTLSISTKRSNRLKFTPDGGRVLVSDMDGDEVVVLDAQTRKQIKRIKTAGHPEGIQMTPDGLRAFVALTQEGVVATIDLKRLEVSSKLQTGMGPDGMAWAK